MYLWPRIFCTSENEQTKIGSHDTCSGNSQVKKEIHHERKPCGKSGAPRKENGLTRQLVVGEEEDSVYYKLPAAKKKQKKNKHDIMDAVDNVRGAEKRHFDNDLSFVTAFIFFICFKMLNIYSTHS